MLEISEKQGGAFAAFSAFVCGAVICAVNIDSLSRYFVFLGSRQTVIFLILSFLGSYMCFGAFVLTVNSFLFGFWACAFAYAGNVKAASDALYLKNIFPVFICVTVSIIISDQGFYTADYVTDAFYALPREIKRKGISVMILFAFAAIALTAIYTTVK